MADFIVDGRVEVDPSDPDRYTGSLSPNWAVWGPNGGYTASIDTYSYAAVSALMPDSAQLLAASPGQRVAWLVAAITLGALCYGLVLYLLGLRATDLARPDGGSDED